MSCLEPIPLSRFAEATESSVMPLLDLLAELLNQIFEAVGARSFHSSANNLLVCKRWYQMALSFYLSSLRLSTLRLSSYTLELLPPPSAPLFNLIRANVRRLSIRLVNHPSKHIAEEPWHDNIAVAGENTLHEGISTAELHEQPEEHQLRLPSGEKWVGSMPQASLRTLRRWYGRDDKEEAMLQHWVHSVNTKLVELAEELPGFDKLEEFSLEASRDHYMVTDMHRDYLYASTIKSLSVICH